MLFVSLFFLLMQPKGFIKTYLYHENVSKSLAEFASAEANGMKSFFVRACT
jgi:hypothetical protein